MSRYASVVLDMDSTLTGVEGIDWLAKRRGPSVAREVAALTGRAMNGELQLDHVYGARLALIQPSASDLAALAYVYTENIAPGAPEAIEQMRSAEVKVLIISGGILQAILPCARGAVLGFADPDVHAVRVHLDERGEYQDYDSSSPLTTQNGKSDLLRALSLPRPLLAVGDGSTDAAMAPVADYFAAFTGFVRREAVVAAARSEVRTFDDLLELVFQ